MLYINPSSDHSQLDKTPTRDHSILLRFYEVILLDDNKSTPNNILFEGRYIGFGIRDRIVVGVRVRIPN